MKQTLKRTYVGVALSLFLATILIAQEGGDEKVSSQRQGKEVQQVEQVEEKPVKQKQIRGVEISVVNSTVQDGVQPATQVNLEKVLRLLSQPKPKPKPQPAAAAGLGGRKKSKPKPGGGGGDARRSVSTVQDPLNTGS